MQKIRFTYKSSEVRPSVFLLLYFRMTGIYVYERYFDSPKENRVYLLHCLPEGKETTLLDSGDDYDLDLFFVADKEDWHSYNDQYGDSKLECSPKRIVVFSDKYEKNPSYREQTLYYGECLWSLSMPMEQEEDLLSEIIEQMVRMEIISLSTSRDLQACQKIYTENQIWKLSLLGKYFYVAEEDEQYRDIKKQYRVTVEAAFKILSVNRCSWGGDKYIHLQYAALNMAYEGDLYCIRNNKALLYDPHSLVHVCRLLLESGIPLKQLEDSIYILIAQIYDDLLKDSNMAYKFYLPACKDYNAYVYYRKGNYWQDFAKDYENAIKYYKKSVRIYPEYYRAWYRLGSCYMLAGRCAEALEVFRNIDRILEPRLEMKKIRPMEIEYLFKAQNQCAYICNKILNNPQQSIRENFRAERVWKAIEDSEFFDFFVPEQDVVRQRVKNQLDVSKIYYEIYLLANKIGDRWLKQEYLNKIIST